jgi:hypothetical protein
MALFNECIQSCVHIELDTAEIVRDGDFSQLTAHFPVCRPPLRTDAESPSDSGAGLERNRGRDLECVSLEGRSALEFTKILKPDAHLLLR